MLFRQLFDRETCTYTYLLADTETKEAVLIDPVLEHVERDAVLLEQLGLKLVYALNTHVHADHISGTGKLKERIAGAKSVLGSGYDGAMADVFLKDGESVKAGTQVELVARHTPGHTAGCVTYVTKDNAMCFTGDAVLIRGCGRTDFQGGSAETLYQSVHSKVFSLPDSTVIWPAHDYKGQTCSTVGEEKKHNPRLTKTQGEFVEIMANLGLPYPKKMDESVPANMKCGLYEVK